MTAPESGSQSDRSSGPVRQFVRPLPRVPLTRGQARHWSDSCALGMALAGRSVGRCATPARYDLAELNRRVTRCGFRTDEVWADEKRYFAVLYLTVATAGGFASADKLASLEP